MLTECCPGFSSLAGSVFFSFGSFFARACVGVEGHLSRRALYMKRESSDEKAQSYMSFAQEQAVQPSDDQGTAGAIKRHARNTTGPLLSASISGSGEEIENNCTRSAQSRSDLATTA